MAQIIAGIYEIQNRIGAGGGGIVYLGRHLRLDKQVVLKADRRTLDTATEKLRREVDMLKDLSHTYIPQVYDFVQEDGVVYTVMDFIEGESLDKLLKRGQRMTQPQVIQWACQLLEALVYLHSRPPHGILHGDIKPANIMLRPSGDICLIDYNIALALGEDGAVKAGYSRGYASPEHYGSFDIESASDERTLLLSEKEKTGAESSPSMGKSTTGKQGGIMLDVRSDIYSLGATLYHLLSGRRPAEKALEVQPLSASDCSLAVAEIIGKAMAPDADMRYQSAREMLTAFSQLHKKDERVIRHKKHIKAWAAGLSLSFLLGGAGCFVGLKQLEGLQRALTLAEYSADALAEGEVTEAVELAMQAIPAKKGILEAPFTPQAQKALTDALGVYDLSEGYKALDAIELPGAPFFMTLSPEGKYLAVVYAYELAVFELETQKEIVTLPVQHSALSEVLFLDENSFIYAGDDGIAAYDLEKKERLWAGEEAVTIAVSNNGKKAAALNREKDYAVIYDVSEGRKIGECPFEGRYMGKAVNDIFANPADDIFTLNEEGNLLAVSFENGGLTLFDLENPKESLIIYETSDYRRFEGGFFGNYFAFTAWEPGNALFEIVDIEKKVCTGKYQGQDGFLLQADAEGICLGSGNLLVSLEPDSMEEKELAYSGQAKITSFSKGGEYIAAATDDNSFCFYDKGANLLSRESCSENCDFVLLKGNYAVLGNRSEPSVRILKLEKHEEAQLLSYDARYGHDEARVSENAGRVMLFGYESFRIYDKEGSLLTETRLPDAESIYDQQFIRSSESDCLEVIWYDGTVRRYSAEDGSIIMEESGKKPDKDLYEEFYVKGYRIASALHEPPKVYDAESGRFVAELEKDDYLTYVTQAGDNIITEYISASGERYGLLLDKDFQKLAYLPCLCDVTNEGLVFDYPSGNLRQCRLYSLQELKALGETYLKENKRKEDFLK